MDIATLRAIYTATSQDFDRVTDHVQRRLKETQGVASGLGGTTQTVANEVKKIESTLTSRAPVKFLGIDVAGEKKAAAEVVNTARTAAEQVQQATTKFDSTTFWARQGTAAASAAKTTETETKRVTASVTNAWSNAAAAEERLHARRAGAATRATSTLIRDAKTGAALTQAELAKVIGSGSKAIESEATKVGKFTAGILGDLRKLFLQNNFLFRQIGQRAAGDLGFAAVGVGKLALNFQGLVSRQLGAAASQSLLNTAFQKFQGILASVAIGRNKAAGDLFSLFKVDLLAGVRAPEQAFAKFLTGFRGVKSEADRAAFAVSVFGKDAIKLLPALETVAAGTGEVSAGLGSILTVAGPVGIAIGVVAVGLVALAAASIASAAGMFYFAKSVSDNLEHFDDLSRQTGLSTDNLQVLDIVTQQAGTNLIKLTNSVGQLQRKLIDASEGGTSRFSVGLKKLGIDLEDPNVALSQLIDLLIKLPAGTARTGAALQIFGRGGRDVAGVIDQIAENVGTADGALERLKKQFIDSGIHIDKDGVQNAAKFHDKWIEITAQFESVKRVIGEEALPTVLRAAAKFSDWIARNRTEIADWAKGIEHAAESLVNLGATLLRLTGLALVIPVTIQLRILDAIGAPSGDTTTDIASAVARRFGQKALPPEQTLLRGTFTEDEKAQMAAAEAAKKIRDAFAPTKRGGSGGKGEDPAQTARRLAEIALQEMLKGFQAEHDALQRQLDQNLVVRNRYTQDAINLELKRRQATIEGLQKELSEAEKIRKPGQRAIKVAEINARLKEEERRSASEVEKITDDSAAEQLRIGQAAADSQLRIIEAQTDRAKARIRDYANFRMISEQQAAEFEQNQTLRVFNARQRVLENDRRQFVEGSERYEDLTNKLNELDEERKSFLAGSSRAIEAAIRNDAENVVRFVAQIRDAFQRAADVRLEAGDANLEPLRNSILTRHQLWDAELEFEITREDQRHRTVMRQLQDEAKLARIRIKNENELALVLRGIRAQAEAEEALHQARLQQLNTQAAEQRRQELLQVADDLASIASDIFDAIGKSSDEFWKSLKQSASNFAKQIRDELFKGFLEKLITGQSQGSEGLIGAIINPLLGATGPNLHIADNTKATQANTNAINSLTRSMGGAPAISGGLSGVMQLIPGLFGGGRASGGSVDAGRIYQIHDNEFFRPSISGKIYNLDQMSAALNQSSSGEVRTIVALGDDAVSEAMESHRLTPTGRRAAIVRGRWNRKTGGLQFA